MIFWAQMYLACGLLTATYGLITGDDAPLDGPALFWALVSLAFVLGWPVAAVAMVISDIKQRKER